MSKAHKVRGTFSVTQVQKTLVQFTCPSGCLTGYLWGLESSAVAAFAAIMEEHAKTHEEEK